MNFPVQYNWLKDYLKLPADPKNVAKELTLYGAPVERIQVLKHQWTNVVVAQILKIERHPNADKLQLATVTEGKGKTRLVVCGAPNIAVGQKVPLALPGAYINEQMTIARREVRGQVSDGMLCSARELGLTDDHTGILVLHPDTPLGVNLDSLGSRLDYLLEIEPTTNRPDVKSVIGVAREISAILGLKLDLPRSKPLPTRGKSALSVTVREKKLCLRYLAITIDKVQVSSSPWWMQERLVRAGLRPINNIVDVTNYVLLEYGQPLHAFDKELLGDQIEVRMAKAGEKILALDGNTYDLKPTHLVIADSKKPVAIAGVMGGQATAVTDKTQSIVLECATFDPISIRRTSRSLNLFSDSSQLFDKGLSTEAVSPALARAIELVLEIAGGEVTGSAVDIRTSTYKPTKIKFALHHIKRLLGTDIPASKVKQNLNRLGFKTSGSGNILNVEVPYWRDHDVSIPEDLVEEVARLYGYHNFRSELPPLNLENVRRDKNFDHMHQLRDLCAELEYVEVMNYSLIRESWLRALRRSPDDVLKLANPLNAELEYMRPSLLPSLLQNIESNLAERDHLRFFELAKTYASGSGQAKDIQGYRRETRHLALVDASNDSLEEAYRRIKGSVQHIIGHYGLAGVVWEEAAGQWPFADGASAVLKFQGTVLGHVGLVHPEFCKNFGVNKTVVAASFVPELLWQQAVPQAFRSMAKFPVAKRDLSLVVPVSLRYSELEESLFKASSLLVKLELFDIYRGSKLARGEQGWSLHLTFRHEERTLKAEEVEAAVDQIIAAADRLGAKLRQ